MPECALYLSHLDRAHAVHRVVDTRGGSGLGLHSNLATPIADSYDLAMVEERAPRLCNDISADPVYATLGAQRRAGAGSYLGVPLELSDGARVGALAALAPAAARFRADDEQLFTMLARVLAYELERESNERDLRRLNDSLRDHARGHGRGRPRRPRPGRGRRRAPRRLPRRLRDGRRAGGVPARALGPRVRLHGDERRGDGAGDHPAAAGHHGPRLHRPGELLRAGRAQPSRARPAARRRHLRPLRPVRARAARRPGRPAS